MRYFFVFFLLAFVLHSAPSLAQTDLPRPSIRITGIDNDFIENLVKARIEIEFPPYHLV